MTSSRNFLLALLAVGAAAFVAPGSAGAKTICVHVPAGTGPCDELKVDLQTALDSALANDGPDTISLGNVGSHEQGPFAYPSGGGEVLIENSVAIKGVGPVRPVLTAPAGATVLKLATGSVEGVDVDLPSAGSGVGIETGAVKLRDVRVTGPGDAFGATGIRNVGNLSLTDVSVTGAGNVGLNVLSGTVTASGLHIGGVARGVGNNDFAHATLTGSKIAARDVAFGSRGTAAISSSVLQTTAAGARGIETGDGSIALDHVSVVHRGAADSTGAAFSVHPVETGGSGTFNAVVLAGYAHGLSIDTSECCSPYPLTIRDSVWDNSHDVFTGGAIQSALDELGDVHVDPKLVDPGNGDFRLRGSSLAVDKDTRTDLRYTDADGIGPVDGDANGDTRADAGALEYRRGAPSIGATDVAASGVTGQALSFTAAGADPDGDTLQFAWDFGDGQVGAGAQAQHTYTAPGIYTVALHVTDEVGLSAARTFTIAVSSAPATAGSSGGATAGAAADLLAPKLSKLRFAKARRALRFTISERAKVRVTVGGVKVVKTVSPGRHSIALKQALRRAKRLADARVAVRITATDAAGNRSATRTLKLRVAA